MNNYCIGIDPGIKGAIVCVAKTHDGYRIHWAEPMPIVRLSDRPAVDVDRFMGLIPNNGTPIILELPQLGMGKNPASQGSVQYQCGQIMGALHTFPVESVYPSVWTYSLRVPYGQGKKGHFNWARGIFGAADAEKYFIGARGGLNDGVVDAALIATYGLITKGG